MQQPVLPDGRLTQKGLEATKEIVNNLFYVCGDERFSMKKLKVFSELFASSITTTSNTGLNDAREACLSGL